MNVIQHYNIEAGDILLRDKKGLGPLINHYAIALGYYNGQYLFIENNQKKGVQVITANEFFQDSTGVRIEKLNPLVDREKIIKTALSYRGTKYSVTNFNCEHFVNLVITGQSKSQQVVNFTNFLGITAFALILNKTFR